MIDFIVTSGEILRLGSKIVTDIIIGAFGVPLIVQLGFCSIHFTVA